MDNLTTKQEVKLLRSALIGLIGRDKEGHYRPELVKEMFGSLKRNPTHTLKKEEDFLEEIKYVK